ncbi:unnamed protein product [Mesocestoides corti]|uniref:DUF5738 domain-containing protein n=1 Tax=Mesocestoides corti TaxID=53468 RepID=A0A0R3U7Y9_MESCO|nr:unnamed protein product [Mesocestoides corti]
MNFGYSYRRYRGRPVWERNHQEADQDLTHAESVVTAPYNSFTGVTLQKGAALAAEIENYRRRVLALLTFFDSVAPHWWDQLHRFNGEMVKRPSRSAERLVKVQARLKARLARLTTRMVIPAAAAVATIEERDTIAVLPRNLFHSATNRERRSHRIEGFENKQETLKLAYSIARRLGEVERSKQQVILHAADWINSDGRDFALRAHRLALLTKNIKHCLIEKFRGVQALITHYYRRRSSNKSDDDAKSPPHEEQTDPKSRLMHAFCEVTAASINTTNSEIVRIMANADLTLATDPAFTTDFIKNYAPNVFPATSYSFSSGTAETTSIEKKASSNEDRRSIQDEFVDAILQDGVVITQEPTFTTISPTPLEASKQAIRWLTGGKKTPTLSGSKGNKAGEKLEEDVDAIAVEDEELSFLRRGTSSDVQQIRNHKNVLSAFEALKEANWQKAKEEEMQANLMPLPVKHSSSSTAAASTLPYVPSASYEEVSGQVLTAGDSTQTIAVPQLSQKPSKGDKPTQLKSVNKSTKQTGESSQPAWQSGGSRVKKDEGSPLPSDLSADRGSTTNLRSFLKQKKPNIQKRSLHERHAM